jgi:uncharacterized protein (DUF2147 family)
MRAAAALLLLAGFTALPAPAAERNGLPGTSWATTGDKGRVAFYPCPENTSLLCGKIVWLAEPNDRTGKPLTDMRNPDEKQRGRPIMGLQILQGFRWSEDKWQGGQVYNPETGNTYDATLEQEGIGSLKLTGCVLFLCRAEHWDQPRKTK